MSIEGKVFDDCRIKLSYKVDITTNNHSAFIIMGPYEHGTCHYDFMIAQKKWISFISV